jgi:general stress protein 26
VVGFLPDGDVAFWTYAASQKVKNLERDPRLTGLVETGERYDELMGVELVGTGAIVRDNDTVQAVGESVWERYNGPVDDQARAAVAAAGAKRAVVRVDVDEVVSWDHRKLGGRY